MNFSVVGQTRKSLTLKLDSIQSSNIHILQKNKHLLGIQIVKNKGVFAKGVKVSDTLYIYIKKNNGVDSLSTSFNFLEQKLKDVNLHYYNAGLIFNKLNPDSISIVQSSINLYYSLHNVSILKIDSISFSKKLPNNIIKNINRHFMAKQISKENTQRIRYFISKNTNYFVNKGSNVFFKHKKNVLNIVLKKVQKNNIDGLLGFNYDNSKKKVSFTGQLNANLYNSLNANEKIHFRWQKNAKLENYLIDIDFPFLRGSDFGIKNRFQLQRIDTTEIALYNQFEITWQNNNQLFAIHYTIDNKENITKTKKKDTYYGLVYSYKWSSETLLEKFGYVNQTTNTISINANSKNFAFFTFNQLNFNIKTFRQQGLFFSGINYYSNKDFRSQFLNTNNNVFRDNFINNDEINSLQIVKSAYYFVNNNQTFYSIHDFVNENTLRNRRKTYINLGIGTHLLRKNQILTLNIFVPIYISKTTDNQEVYITIKQVFNF